MKIISGLEIEKSGDVGAVATSWSWSLALLFVMFGMGTQWLFVWGLWQELVIYFAMFSDESIFNQMVYLYSIAALIVPVFLGFRVLLKYCMPGRDINYPLLVYGLGAIEFALCVSMVLVGWETPAEGAIADTGKASRTRNVIAIMMFIGGCLGNIALFVHFPYILMEFGEQYVSFYRLGDACGALLSTLLAILQRPGLARPVFDDSIYFAIMACCVPPALIAFFFIQRSPERLSLRPRSRSSEVGLSSEVGFSSACKTVGPSSVSVCQTPTFSMANLAFIQEQPGIFAVMSFCMFMAVGLNWGLGDSIYPYACQYATVHADDKADTNICIEQVTIWTTFTVVLAQFLHSFISPQSIKCIIGPFLAIVLISASILAGCVSTAFADPFGQGSSYTFMLTQYTLLRLVGPFVVTAIFRLLPSIWAQRYVEMAATVMSIMSVLGANAGAKFATWLIETAVIQSPISPASVNAASVTNATTVASFAGLVPLIADARSVMPLV